jgi:iron complex outermembrane receptor protein
VPTLSFDPPTRTDELVSAFVQDQVGLAGGRLQLTAGAKLEHNDYSGLEIQPSVRALWRLTGRQAVWTAASRAVRTPTRADADLVGSYLATARACLRRGC